MAEQREHKNSVPLGAFSEWRTRPTRQTVAEDRSEASLCSYLLTIPALETRVDRSENYVDPPDAPNCRRRSIGGLSVLVPPNDPSSRNSSRSFRKLRRPARQMMSENDGETCPTPMVHETPQDLIEPQRRLKDACTCWTKMRNCNT